MQWSAWKILVLLVGLCRHIECADDEVTQAPTVVDRFSRDWTLQTGEHGVAVYSRKIDRAHLFAFANCDMSKQCEVTLALVGDGDKVTTRVCTVKLNVKAVLVEVSLRGNNRDEVVVLTYAPPNAGLNRHMAYTNMDTCGNAIFGKAEEANVTIPEVTLPSELRATTWTREPETGEVTEATNGTNSPSQATRVNEALSFEHDKRGTCRLHGQTIKCEYELWNRPCRKHYKAPGISMNVDGKIDWMAVHNRPANDKIMIITGKCPDNRCNEFTATTVAADGSRKSRFVVGNLNVQCQHDPLDFTMMIFERDDKDQICFVFVCSKDAFSNNKKVSTTMQYRRNCVKRTSAM